MRKVSCVVVAFHCCQGLILHQRNDFCAHRKSRGRGGFALDAARSQYGTQEYWQSMYEGQGDHNAEEYSWYYGWDVLKRHWEYAVPDKSANILVPGIGNEPTLLDMFASGWKRITAFDYAPAAIERQRALLEYDTRALESIDLHVWDATKLPVGDSIFDAVLEKGALDAIFLSGEEQMEVAISELRRVLVPQGRLVSCSGVIPDETRRLIFPETHWKWLRDGTDDLQAGCFVLEKI